MEQAYWYCSQCKTRRILQINSNVSLTIEKCPKCGSYLDSRYDVVERLNEDIPKTENSKGNNKTENIQSNSNSPKDKVLDIKEINRMINELKEKEKAMEILIKEKTKGFPWLAKAWADYLALLDTKKEKILLTKNNPALKSADIVSEIKHEKRILNKENRILKYTIEYYEALFPWLSDFKEEGIDELIVEMATEDLDSHNENHDEAIHWLSQAEYNGLSNTEKYQKALDRYKASRGKPWQIGRDYERYIGYKYESEGYSVTYHGIIEGFGDMGRDLICRKDNETLIVQCKCWSKHKTIHEKHINQLFGTSIMYRIQNPREKVFPIFVSSTSLSDTAKTFAEALGVQVVENCKLDKDYPIIKCNISKKDGTKIYHLPFDQQYDSTVICNTGECYVKSVADAEGLGFRRALRWKGKS